MMVFRNSALRFGLLLTFQLGLSFSARAQTVWAAAASGNWNTAASWNPATVPGDGVNASIIVAGTFTVTYDSPMSAGSIASLTLGSGSSIPTLTLTAAGFNVAGSCTFVDSAAEIINVSSGGVMTNGTLAMTSRNGVLNVNNGGTLRNAFTQVANNNSVDGSTQLKINSGAVANLGAVTIGRHTQSSSLGLNISGGTVTASSIDVGVRNSYANMVVSGGSLTNTGSLRLGTGVTTTSPQREIRYQQTGGTVVCAGPVDLAVATNYTTWFSVLGASATLYADGVRIFPNALASASFVRFTNSGNIYLGTSGFKALNSGTYTVALNDQSLLGATADWSGNVNLVTPASGTITFKCADAGGTAHNITLTNPISGGASLVKTGDGALTFLGANTFTGSTTVSAGSLVLGNATALPKGMVLTVGGSGTAGVVDLAGFNQQISSLATAGTAANQLITNSSAANISTLTFSNSTGSSTFGGVIAGGTKPVALTVLGGSLTLSAQNNYAGNIFISNGRLALSGSGSTFTGAAIVLSNAAALLDLTGMNNLTLAAGQSLSGFGVVTGSVMAANCPLTPGANGSGGTLMISGNLTFNGGVTNQFDLLLDPNATGSDLINVSGVLNVSGLNTIKLNALGGSLSEGTYHLIKSGSVGSGDTNNFQIVGSSGSGLLAAVSVTSTGVDLVVFQAGGAERVWVGDGSANWWDQSSVNWLKLGNPDTFTNGNFVVFDDTSTNLAVNLTGTLQPATVTVDATNDYTFAGSGKISGVVVLTKTNSGTLTILTTNDYSGLTTIGQGTVQVGNGVTSGALGGGALLDNGILLMQQPNNSTLGNAINGVGSLVQAGTATLTLAGSNTFSGGLSINSGILQIGNGGTPGNGNVTNNTALIFNNSGNNTVNGGVSGGGSLTLLGSGTVTLAAANTFSGDTIVNAGTLIVNGTNSGNGTVTINSTGKLGGKGTIAGAVIINSGATLTPGTSPGTLTVGSNLTVNAGAIMNFDLGTLSDKVVVGGNLNLTGTLNITDSGGLGNGTYTLFTYGGSLVLNTVTLGTTPSGKLYELDTSTAGQVNLIVGVIATNVPAFPGALGFGSIVTGGRGKPVYHVTTLADSGAGSFRDAVSVSGRIVVFDVGGYISLNTAVSVKGNLTIAGQTAPGGGIGFKGGEISFAGSANIICRYLRIRPGSDTASSTDDALSFYQAKNVIVDHCSIEFAPWNNIDGVGDGTHVITNITVQNCLIADPTGQQFGAHTESVGGTWAWFYNIFVNSHNRNPLAKINTVFVNNVNYNYSAAYTTHTSTSFKHDLLNNYFICGPASSGGGNTWFQIDNNQSMYYSGNLRDTSLDGVLNGSTTVPLPGYQGGGTVLASPWSTWTTNAPVYSPQTAYRLTASRAGAWPRDELDNLIVNQVKTLGSGTTGTGVGTRGPDGGLYTSQAQTGLANNGYGTITGGPAPFDSDGDAMPDYWETAIGLNANNANDATNLTLSGYSQLEVYLNWLGEPHAVVGINTNLDIDLVQYASGFTNVGGIFSISNVVNGTVTLLPGGRIARYVPPANFTGRASFFFKVTGNDGTSMTNTVGLVVTGVAPSQELTWRGDGFANTWNIAAATNWLNGPTPAVFHTGDDVTFDDTGSNSPAINLATVLTPGGLTVAASNNYTFGGSGSVGGSITLIKSGTGTLMLNTTNTYSGGTLVSGGALVLGVPGAAGGGTLTLSGGAAQMADGDFLNAISISGSGNLIGSSAVNNTLKGAVDGTGLWTLTVPSGRVVTEESDNSGFTGTINLAGPGTYRLNQGGFTWGNAGCVYDLGSGGTLNNRATVAQNIYLGSLTGGLGSQLRGSDQSGAITDTVLVGALNLDSVFDGSLRDGTGATAHQLAFTKLGGGILTLNGTNTASGATTVSGGTLRVNGSTGLGTVTIASGAKLGGTGKIGGNLTAQSGASLTPGGAAGNAGTLTVSNNLTLTGANLLFDFANATTVGGGVNDLIALNGGTLSLSGVSTVVPNYLNGSLAAGAYTLITGCSATIGSAANLAWSGASGSRQIVSFDTTTPGTVLLNVSGSLPAALVWQGTNGSNWDLTTTNWLNAGGTDRFFNFDTVLFNDTSTNGSVTPVGALQPGGILVSNAALAYTFNNGGIAGVTTLQKTGPGLLTLSGSNSFTGGTLLQGGDIFLASDVANQSALGTGAVTLDGGTLSMFSSPATTNAAAWNLIVPAASVGRLNTDASCDLFGSLTGGGALTLFTPSTNTTFHGDWSGFTGGIVVLTSVKSDLRMASLAGLPFAALALSNNIAAYLTVDPGADTVVEIGALSGSVSAKLLGAPTESTLTWRVGGRNTDATFAGNIAESGTNTTTAIEKIGTGIWTLSGSNSYAGDTTVSAGTLLVRNLIGSATGSGNVQVLSGATLAGDGIIGGDTTFSASAVLAPGNGVGTLTFNSGLILNDSTVLNFELGTTSDQVVVGGDLLAAGVLNVSNVVGFSAGSYPLFTYDPTNNFTLGNLTLGTVPVGFDYSLSTNTAGLVSLLVAPLAAPRFENISLVDGSFVLTGTGGPADGNYFILTSTNLALPLSNWTRLLTNQFNGAGGFVFTNALLPGVPQAFYRLQLP